MAWGTSWINAELDAVLNGARGPVTLHVHTGDPGSSGANEVPGYAAPVVTGIWSLVADGQATNAESIIITGLPAVTVTHLSLRAGGEQFLGGPCSQPVHIATGSQLEIPPGQMIVRIGSRMEPGDNDLEQARLIVPADRRTVWNPGIPGDIPTERAVYTTLNSLTTDGTGDNGPTINAAIQAAGDVYDNTGVIQEILLPAGTIRFTTTILLNRSGVVLRGAGVDANGVNALTKLRFDGVEPTNNPIGIRFSRNPFYSWDPSTHGPFRLTADGVRGSKEIKVSNADGTRIEIGDVLAIDVEDDVFVTERNTGGWRFDKRQPPSSAPGGDNNGPPLRTDTNYRSVTSIVQVVDKIVGDTDTTLVLREPLHMDFPLLAADGVTPLYPEIWHVATKYSASRPTMEGVHYSGIEDLYITGGGIAAARLAFCWIRNVEIDGNPETPHIGTYSQPGSMGDVSLRLTQCYRCIVRRNYVHHKWNIGQGGAGYLLTLYTYSAENLIEDNIVVFGNKGILGNMMGGGNVIAYNYVDGAATNDGGGWQEGGINLNHRPYPHSALVEGNDSVNLGVDTTHGISGMHVFFRNFARGQNIEKLSGAYPWVVGNDVGFQRAAGTDGYHREVAWIGNVLHHSNNGTPRYQVDPSTGPQITAATIWRIGQAYQGIGDNLDDGTALAFTYRHHNWDQFNGAIVDDDPSNTVPLPPSLYLTRKPGWWPAGVVWPPVNPDGATHEERVATIPARARYEAIKGG